MAIQEALNALTPDDHTLLHRKADGWTPCTIVEELGISRETAYKRLQRAKQRFLSALAFTGNRGPHLKMMKCLILELRNF